MTKAIGKYIRLSPKKAARILNQIRGKSYQEAKLILEFIPYKGCKIIKKILDSAVSNITHNTIENTKIIFIKQAIVSQGPKLKRFQPRAQGRAFPIHKPTCHITIYVLIK